MNDIIEKLEWRYAVKKFDPRRRVPDSQLNTLKRAFNLTATSYGLQPIRLVVLGNKEVQQKLLPASYRQPQVAEASHVLIFCIERRIDSDYIQDYFNRVKRVRGTSDEILDPYRARLVDLFSAMDDTHIEEWARNQAFLAMGNLLTICAVLQIDSCPMEGFEPGPYSSILGLDTLGLQPVLVLPIGYRAGDDQFSGFKKVRRDLESSIITIT